ncbi:hypothetical protein KIN20_015592 [Parelaphostrongylus tenuis]|uniref:5-hydroxyisourate hydrolase n=1 Tax=Parelaphostrongylus tenuis TaxID=148309 RepID=A0AAD5MJU5_PARTN|nr:hypothetical protein KIN20_015592 [Parelaphostrongylus tenuis]
MLFKMFGSQMISLLLLIPLTTWSASVPMVSISSHVLDTTIGKPAEGVMIVSHLLEGKIWKEIGTTFTGKDGRVKSVSPQFLLRNGTYKLFFDVESYFNKTGVESFYPYVEVVFKVNEPVHYHIPLTVTPYSYSTYRGS